MAPKSHCKGPCKKEYNTSTLDNHDGVCGRCYNKSVKETSDNNTVKVHPEATQGVEDVLLEELAPGKGYCKGEECTKVLAESTLRRNKGWCSKCAKINGLEVGDNRTLRRMMWEDTYGFIPMKCIFCNVEEIDPLSAEIGHDVADSKGGSKTRDNIKPICRTCNMSQGNLTFAEFRKTIPYIPMSFMTHNYDQRRALVKKWCIWANGDKLSNDKIHRIISSVSKFSMFSVLCDYTSIIILSKNFRRKTVMRVSDIDKTRIAQGEKKSREDPSESDLSSSGCF